MEKKDTIIKLGDLPIEQTIVDQIINGPDKKTEKEQQNLCDNLIPELKKNSNKIVNDLNVLSCKILNNILFYASKEKAEELSNSLMGEFIINLNEIANNKNQNIRNLFENVFLYSSYSKNDQKLYNMITQNNLDTLSMPPPSYEESLKNSSGDNNSKKFNGIKPPKYKDLINYNSDKQEQYDIINSQPPKYKNLYPKKPDFLDPNGFITHIKTIETTPQFSLPRNQPNDTEDNDIKENTPNTPSIGEKSYKKHKRHNNKEENKSTKLKRHNSTGVIM